MWVLIIIKKSEWAKANLNIYKANLDKFLSEVNIPNSLLGCGQSCKDSKHIMATAKYYTALISCIKRVTEARVPLTNNQSKDNNVYGWSDLVKDKYDIAR